MNPTLREQERAAYMAGNYALADALDRLERLETAALTLLHALPPQDDELVQAAWENLHLEVNA